jgi:hypothetical protein
MNIDIDFPIDIPSREDNDIEKWIYLPLNNSIMKKGTKKSDKDSKKSTHKESKETRKEGKGHK